MLAAYTRGGPWLDGARAHVAANVAWLSAFLRAHVPEVAPVPPEATYLVWLECSALLRLLRRAHAGASAGPAHAEEASLHAGVLRRAGLLLSPGDDFAPDGEAAHFLRINVACGRPVLRRAAEQLRVAVQQLRREAQTRNAAEGRGESEAVP